MPEQRARVLGYFLLAGCLLVVYLAFHVLPCMDSHSDHKMSASEASVAQVDLELSGEAPHDHSNESHCEHVPSHASGDPHCLALPRSADASGLALSGLLLSLIPALTSADNWRYRLAEISWTSEPKQARSGKTVLCVLCVMRR